MLQIDYDIDDFIEYCEVKILNKYNINKCWQWYTYIVDY